MIGYVTQERKILQTIPQSLVQALIDGEKQQLYLYPNGKDQHIDISSAIAVTSATRIKISKEDTDMYVDLGTTFQLCKICSENPKDRQLEPCGHLICSTCLENWIDRQRQPTCPFCRCEIKTFVPIEFDMEEKAHNKSFQKDNVLVSKPNLSRKDSKVEIMFTHQDSDSDEYLNPVEESEPKSNRHSNNKAPSDQKPLNQINNQFKTNPSTSSLKPAINQASFFDEGLSSLNEKKSFFYKNEF